MTDADTINDLSERFGKAITGADMNALDALLSPDFTIWYNFSDETLSREQAMAFFTKYFSEVSVRFSNIKRVPTSEGWLQQHRIDADGPDGFKVCNMPACLVFTVDNGKISSAAEYFDSAQTVGFDQSQMTA